MFYLLQIEKIVTENRYMYSSAKEAFKTYVRAYDSHHLKQIFNVETLDLNLVGKSFGFSIPPAINLRILFSQKETNNNFNFNFFFIFIYVGLKIHIWVYHELVSVLLVLFLP